MTDDTSQLAPRSLTADATGTTVVDAVLDLEQILSSAKRAERTVPICVDGPARREYEDALKELSQLVDADGEIIGADGDVSLAEKAAANAANERTNQALAAVKRATHYFRVRAMPEDEFAAWDKSFDRDANGNPKDDRRYENELISRCLISPLADLAGVEKLRSTLGRAQVIALFNGAFFVNTRDGLDVPFSPSFLRAPKPKEQ